MPNYIHKHKQSKEMYRYVCMYNNINIFCTILNYWLDFSLLTHRGLSNNVFLALATLNEISYLLQTLGLDDFTIVTNPVPVN